MSDLIDDPLPGVNAPEFTVSELSGAIKRVIEGEFANVRIKAEIGRVSVPRSGHIYLDLKDDRSVISAVIWKGVANKLSVRPEEGMEVIATGRVTTFAGQSKYQIIIEDIKPAGMGALMAMLEKRKKMLEAEGLFDPARKRPLPYLPEIIGVVTSPSGAVIRDILHRLRDRFPRKVLIWPVAVQGDKCAPEVARAIEGFNQLSPGGALPRPDLLIVARGGGSIEDLWGFNEEIVARATAGSDIPLISAVGHETDTTLIDFVSDKRAPTPTAAAELAVPVRMELLAWTDQQGARLNRTALQAINQRSQRLRDLGRAMPRPDSLLDTPRQRLDRAAERLPKALIGSVQNRRITLSEATGSLRPSVLNRQIAEGQRRLAASAPRIGSALRSNIARKNESLGQRSDRLSILPVKRTISLHSDQLRDLSRRLSKAATAQTEAWHTRIDALDRLRETLGYKATLRRGYAVVRDSDQVITSRDQAKTARSLEIEFADGRFDLSPKAKSSPAKAPKSPPEQGDLF